MIILAPPTDPDMNDDRIAELETRLAELAVAAVDVQVGQLVAVTSSIGKEPLTRKIARAAYERGAKYVDVFYFDQWLKRERIALADEETLDYVPPWLTQRLLHLSDERGARISLSGPQAPDALRDLDPARAGRDRLPYLAETGEVVNARTTSWTVVPGPTAEWAAVVYPELDRERALEALWEDIALVCRLDEDDPAAAWEERTAELEAIADRISERRFDAIRLRGPGTDLVVGLLPSSRWQAGSDVTVDGIRHQPNIPTEEIFTTPDPLRADGHVRATMPLQLFGTLVDGIRIEFEGGRAVAIEAAEGADALRAAASVDEGAARLGEIALVDGNGRVGSLGRIFRDTLIDENAASHLALGSGYQRAVGDAADKARANRSRIHVDFMVGSPELEVDGITRDGDTVPVLRDGAWQI
ncbi:MAG: aminopeptidase T [Gaiellaceae bacterium]|jgi:aminopeptidase|nr:MAG: aminopeptidase T [Gaiellaceae bacterium]